MLRRLSRLFRRFVRAFRAVQEIEKICRSVLVADRLRLTLTIYQSGDSMQAKPVTNPTPRSQSTTVPKPKQKLASFSGDEVDLTMLVTQSCSALAEPVDAESNPSQATLSDVVYTSSDSTVFTVAVDPSTPNGAIVTGVGVGTATLSATATATEPDGVTTEQISGACTVTLTAST